MKNFGGNILNLISLKKNEKKILCDGPYHYSINSLTNEDFIIENLKSFSLFILELTNGTKIYSSMLKNTIDVNTVIQCENIDRPLDLKIVNGKCIILISGCKKNSKLEKNGIFVNKKDELYKVTKPWGHELWINGEHELYAFKEIFIKAGTKTSLQFHNFKQETNLLVRGDALLHYNSSNKANNKDLLPNDISTVEFSELSSVDVSPPVVHRIEAVTDILLYETSTPHLNDVIRISDDTKRTDGRIQKEHITK